MTKYCSECGSTNMLRFENRSRTRTVAGVSEVVDGLSGWECGTCGEYMVLDEDSQTRYAAAGDRLVLAARSQRANEFKKVRTFLGVTQQEAAEIFGGGKNAANRYEKGLAEPVASTKHLLKILSVMPEAVDLLQDVSPEIRAKILKKHGSSSHAVLPGVGTLQVEIVKKGRAYLRTLAKDFGGNALPVLGFSPSSKEDGKPSTLIHGGTFPMNYVTVDDAVQIRDYAMIVKEAEKFGFADASYPHSDVLVIGPDHSVKRPSTSSRSAERSKVSYAKLKISVDGESDTFLRAETA
ncbi:type II TA system antitoxin MqsA family protein [Stenotrophomonas maltophilia]|uniref:type II TA system antitoxin MqsA family protein n=1 Tax=Stenotrophomonas maltophilia TaxID=40324 RepID=UPI0013110A4B